MRRSAARGGEVAQVAAKRRPPAARAIAAPSPTRAGYGRIAPSGRSLLVAFGLLALAAGGYAAARETSIFAVTALDVRGASPAVARDVRKVLEPVRGKSLVAVDGADIAHRLTALPWVASVTLDRSFPHTLRVTVTPEQPVAVLRRGADAWLVSAEGRVLEMTAARKRPRLPRIWLAASSSPLVGAAAEGGAALAVAALAPAAGTPFLGRVRFVRQGGETLTLVLRSGVEVRLGDTAELPLKLEIARAILPGVAPPAYLDLSVPERPVLHANTQVEG